MSMILFILSVLIIIGPMVLVFICRTYYNYGIGLKKSWLFMVVMAELVLLALAWIDYGFTPNDVASDFMWHNLFIYHRGILPIIGIKSLADFNLNPNSTSTLVSVYLTALMIDYLILRIATYLRTKLKRKPVK